MEEKPYDKSTPLMWGAGATAAPAEEQLINQHTIVTKNYNYGVNESDSDVLLLDDMPKRKQNKVWSLLCGEHSSGGGVVSTIFSVCCCIAGVGILSLPKALSTSGWIGLIFLLVSCLLSAYTAKIIVKCGDAAHLIDFEVKTYADIGHLAFGKPGRYTVLGLQMFNLVGAGILFLVLAGVDMFTLTNVLNEKAWIAISAAIVLPLSMMKHIKDIAITSFLGIGATVFVSVVVVILGGIEIHNNGVQSGVPFATDIGNICLGISTYTLAFSFHAVIPTMADGMADKRKFTSVVNYSYIIVILMYVPVAIIGLLAYGPNVASPVLNSLPSVGVAGVITKIATAVVTLHVFCTFPILINPVALTAESLLRIDNKPYRVELPLRMAIRTVIIGVCCGLGVVLPDFYDLMGLLGAIAYTALSFIVPVVCYLRIKQKHGQKMPVYVWVLGVFIVLVGLLTMISGTISSIQSIIKYAHGS